MAAHRAARKRHTPQSRFDARAAQGVLFHAP
jgi:hypothetical protein